MRVTQVIENYFFSEKAYCKTSSFNYFMLNTTKRLVGVILLVFLFGVVNENSFKYLPEDVILDSLENFTLVMITFYTWLSDLI